ncbi:MAG: UvrD-helicase domain-containing protein [Chloroflexi bacterium]|nr:UvrD-helicase domain-containing protein [Chloroflexota bacterium]
MGWNDGLTAEQVVAASHIGSHARLLAGPGTGKTLVMTRRVLCLTLDHDVSASDILALTFTRAAARELRTRIIQELGESLPPRVSTLHSFALQTLLFHRLQ